jgi:hypothetical protein
MLVAIAPQLGWKFDGTVSDAKLRRASLRRTLDYLEAMGYLEDRSHLTKGNGEGRCIVVRLAAPVAQLDRATPLRRPRRGPRIANPQARLSSSAVLGPPSFGGRLRRGFSLRETPSSAGGGGRARPPRRAVLADANERSDWIDRSAAQIGKLPAREGVALAARLLDGLVADLFGRPGGEGPLRASAQLEAALARLDRYADMGSGRAGAGFELAAELVAATSEDLARGERDAAPRHLGYFVPELRRVARRWKHQQAPRLKATRRQQKAAARGS